MSESTRMNCSRIYDADSRNRPHVSFRVAEDPGVEPRFYNHPVQLWTTVTPRLPGTIRVRAVGWAYDKARAVWIGRFAASQPAMPPAISLTRSNPWRSNKLAAMDDR